MQVARNFFLTREKTVTRKLREVLLAWKIEANLTKDEILELYVNQIFLGQRAYGFAAASQIYFGKPLEDVTVAEAAMLAGLPKAPSALQPGHQPASAAKTRQQYVLRRMHELRFITDDELARSTGCATASSSRECATPSRCTPSSSRKWRGRWCSTPTARRPTRGGITVWTTVRTGRPGGGLRRRAARRDRLRPAPRLPRSGGATSACPTTRPSSEPVLERVFQEHSDSDNLLAAVVLEATPDARCAAVLAQRRQRHGRPATGSSSSRAR